MCAVPVRVRAKAVDPGVGNQTHYDVVCRGVENTVPVNTSHSGVTETQSAPIFAAKTNCNCMLHICKIVVKLIALVAYLMFIIS